MGEDQFALQRIRQVASNTCFREASIRDLLRYRSSSGGTQT
jgi:hypothetical protein